MPNKPRFSYYQHFVKEIWGENGLKRITTDPERVRRIGNDPLTDGEARQKGKGFCARAGLPVAFQGIVLVKDLSRITTTTYTSRRLGDHSVGYPNNKTIDTGLSGEEWVYSIDDPDTAFTVDARLVGGELRMYVGSLYEPAKKSAKLTSFSGEFGSLDYCMRGKLVSGGKVSAKHFDRTARANNIDINLTKKEKCEALEDLAEIVWA